MQNVRLVSLEVDDAADCCCEVGRMKFADHAVDPFHDFGRVVAVDGVGAQGVSDLAHDDRRVEGVADDVSDRDHGAVFVESECFVEVSADVGLLVMQRCIGMPM